MIDALVGVIATALIGPFVTNKSSHLIGSALMALSGTAFVFYGIYLLITREFDNVAIVASILMLMLALGSFYLMKRAWKNQND